jgi:diacylglycerol kinase family enzyme
VRQPEVRALRTTSLRITVEPGAPVQADGEIVATDAREIVYSVLPGALEVLVPDPDRVPGATSGPDRCPAPPTSAT